MKAIAPFDDGYIAWVSPRSCIVGLIMTLHFQKGATTEANAHANPANSERNPAAMPDSAYTVPKEALKSRSDYSEYY